MTAVPWRGVINAILYTVQSSPRLTDEVVEQFAQDAIARPFSGLTTTEIAGAVTEALSTQALLTALLPDAHSEVDFRDFLRRLADRLNASRPFPVRPYRVPQPAERRYDARVPVAHVGLGHFDLQRRLRENFEQDSSRAVLPLVLATGEYVTLVGPWGGTAEDGFVLLGPADGRPGPAVAAAFREATGLGDAVRS